LKITSVEPIVLRLDQVDVTRADGTQDAFLVKIHTDEGLVGIGEADTSPYVARTIVEMPSSHLVARGLAELLVGEDPLDVARLWQRMYEGSAYYGRTGPALHTISALDQALWDIAGKAQGRPICKLMTDAPAREVSVYASEVMPETPEEAREIARRAVSKGYRALKLGWGPLGQSLDRDAELVFAARDGLGPEPDLMIDGGQAYTVETTLEFLDRVKDAHLYWFEEPLLPDDYDGYRRLTDATATRIAAGEADSGVAPFRTLLERGGVDVLQPDMGRCGGLTVARKIGELTRDVNAVVVPHCFSTGILVAASLQLAASLPRPTYSEYSVAESPLAGGLLTKPFQLHGGKLPVPSGPGLGVELDEELVSHLRYA
jgi:L-alanine-DL-glutamate epimerase-like enolase superfamily enzyme